MRSNNNGHNNHHHQSIQQFQPKTIFLPIFCRLSLNDINNQNNTRNRIRNDEPSSPKVTCIGQVKRNNRVTTTSVVETNYHKHTKPTKILSTKALLPPNTTARSGNRTCRNNTKRLRPKNDQVEFVVNVGEMDPPLPVVKKVGRDEVNIWKRRFHDTRLERLQIEKIHVITPPTV